MKKYPWKNKIFLNLHWSTNTGGDLYSLHHQNPVTVGKYFFFFCEGILINLTYPPLLLQCFGKTQYTGNTTQLYKDPVINQPVFHGMSKNFLALKWRQPSSLSPFIQGSTMDVHKRCHICMENKVVKPLKRVQKARMWWLTDLDSWICYISRY